MFSFMKFPPAIQRLIDQFSRFPTVGHKAAERFVFYLLRQGSEDLQQLAQAIAELKEKTTVCQICHSYAEKNPCHICSDSKRDQGLICVVSNTREMLTIEATKQYNGLYHILGGVLNVIEGVSPESLNIKHLEEKIKTGKTKEIILALNPDLEGETTSMYLAKLLRPYKIKITRLAKGLPTGASLEYADEMTLTNAMKYRNEI